MTRSQALSTALPGFTIILLYKCGHFTSVSQLSVKLWKKYLICLPLGASATVPMRIIRDAEHALWVEGLSQFITSSEWHCGQFSNVTFVFPFLCPKIESEEFEEALSLAQTYGLDADLVYQRQWRKSAVNIASIQNYLVCLHILVTWQNSNVENIFWL